MFTKRGERVPREASDLRVARHPGVVELVDAVGDVLRTQMVDARPVAQLAPLPAAEVAGLAAAVAATVGDLHELGVVHGGIDASHVLVTTDGRPLLCSLGRGGHPAEDVAAIGRLVTFLLVQAPPEERRRLGLGLGRLGRERLGSMLAPPVGPTLATLAAEAMADDPAGRPTAHALADAIRRRIPGARLPGAVPARETVVPLSPSPSVGSTLERPGGTRRRAVPAIGGAFAGLAVLAAVLAGLTLAGAWVLSRHSGNEAPAIVESAGGRRSPARSAAAPARLAPDGAPPPAPAPAPGTSTTPASPTTTAVATRVWPAERVELRDGVLTYGASRYALGQPGDAVVAGDWDCRGKPSLAVLHTSSGHIFAFDGWPEDEQTLTARPVGRVDRAVDLRVVDLDGDGCHELEVERTGAPPVRVEVA